MQEAKKNIIIINYLIQITKVQISRGVDGILHLLSKSRLRVSIRLYSLALAGVEIHGVNDACFSHDLW